MNEKTPIRPEPGSDIYKLARRMKRLMKRVSEDQDRVESIVEALPDAVRRCMAGDVQYADAVNRGGYSVDGLDEIRGPAEHCWDEFNDMLESMRDHVECYVHHEVSLREARREWCKIDNHGNIDISEVSTDD